jgi:hypothetical protein
MSVQERRAAKLAVVGGKRFGIHTDRRRVAREEIKARTPALVLPKPNYDELDDGFSLFDSNPGLACVGLSVVFVCLID